MIQITPDGIRPHLRINGGWRVWEARAEGLEFENKLKKKNWYKCNLTCDKNKIIIKIYQDRSLIFDDEWEIPNGNNIIFEFKKEENDPKPPFPKKGNMLEEWIAKLNHLV